MAKQGVKRKLTAILSADVEGYSRLMEEDEAATVETLTAYRETITSLIQQHRGRVVDSPGDNLLAEFSSVVDAVQCAVETQELLKAKNAELPGDRRMQFRMGINLGDVIEEGDRIYGDGVNIASRIEALAEPGGICISMSVYDQIKKKLVLGYEDLGERRVKNISEPIRVYRVPLERKAAAVKVGAVKKVKISRWQWAALAVAVVVIIVGGALVIQYYVSRPAPVEPASEKKMAYPLPDKPSLAVLPFNNMSDESELEYLSDGFTDTIIGGLSRMPSIFVISRTSTFGYKKKPVSIKKIAEELGVQYVIEGSIQKSRDQLRITVQMIDALTGYHVWSERYDRSIKDIFKIQDEITLNIAKSIGMKLEGFTRDIPDVAIAGTNNLDAYLKSLRAIYYRSTEKGPEGHFKAKQLVEEAIALDPNYLNAYIGLSEMCVDEARWGMSKFPKKSLEQALKMAQKAVELDESNSYAHSSLGRVLYNLREHDKAIAEFEQAISLDPENAWAYVLAGWTLNWAGRPQEAVPYFKKYMRLDPLNPTTGLFGLAGANLLIGKYEDAIPYIQKAIEKDHPSTWFRYHLDLAACYEALGREKEAKAESQEVLRLSPKFSLKKYIVMLPAKDPEFIKPYVEALQKTGLPE